MINYVLSLVNKKKSVVGINSDIIINKLEEIDRITTCFNDEYDLKEYFIKNGLMSYQDYDKSVCIRYKSKGKVKKLQYGVLYSGDKDFLNIPFIVSYLESKIDDILLLEKLCNHYRNSYIEGTNINMIREYINMVRNSGKISLEDIDKIKDALNAFIIKEIYNYDATSYKCKVNDNGNPIIRYKGVHDLGAFLAWDKRKNLKPIVIGSNKPIIKPIDNSIIPKSSQKVKIKKQKDIPGQLNLFEIENGINN